MLSRVRACSIARAVLDHNRRYPDNPVWVVADDVYAGSHLCPAVTSQPIAALRGADLGDDHLGPVSDHTVTITTPSKTVALLIAGSPPAGLSPRQARKTASLSMGRRRGTGRRRSGRSAELRAPRDRDRSHLTLTPRARSSLAHSADVPRWSDSDHARCRVTGRSACGGAEARPAFERHRGALAVSI